MTRRWRLFPKYALLIITLVGIMLITSGAIGIYFSWRETKDHLVALQVEKAQNAANRIEQYILEIEHQLSWTALPRADADGDALESRRIEYLKLQRQAPAITEVVWIDPKGREQLRISRLAMDAIGSGTDLSSDPKFRLVSTGAVPVYYGPVYFRKGTEPYMTIARPAGSGGGVTAAEVNLKFVWDVVSRIKIGTAGLAYVVDADGVLIAHPDISLVLKKSDLKSLPQVAARDAPPTKASPPGRDLQGNEVFAAHAPIPTLKWTVFVETPSAEAFAPLYASILRAALLLAAGLVVAAAASFFIARALVRPLQALQQGAARIGAGELEHRIEVKTGDELENLAAEFNKMGSELKESYAGLERKVSERTAELSETLEQQTVTAEVLRVISASVSDAQPVFEKITQSCERLFVGTRVGINLVGVDGKIHLAAYGGPKREQFAALFPISLDDESGTGTAIRERRVMHYPDIEKAADVPRLVRLGAAATGTRSVIFAPMVLDDRGIGAITVARDFVGPFSANEIALLKTFADQAVIAIENARLFNETQEALERQTATAEVLSVISGSVADSRPVFDKILESCQRLFASNEQGILLLGDDDQLHLGAHHGAARERLEQLFPVPRAVGGDAAVRERSVIHIKDVLGDPDVAPGLRAIAEQIGVGTYSQVIAPMLWKGESIGSLYVIRQPAVGFGEKEIGLLRTFADQAVIAIQNARLFNETKEALEQQTATADVLQVISGSLADTQPVFERILDSCERLFNSTGLGMFVRTDDGTLRMAASRTKSAKSAEILALATERPGQPGTRSPVGAAIRECRMLHHDDVRGGPEAPDNLRHLADRVADYSIVVAPLLHAGSTQGTGALLVVRDPAR
ncbi:MAG TPA: GAF domain-containing protein, partial [Caldimonas sp.]|nr:GAF domain-containing protein [Caldimonas sp.]